MAAVVVLAPSHNQHTWIKSVWDDDDDDDGVDDDEDNDDNGDSDDALFSHVELEKLGTRLHYEC